MRITFEEIIEWLTQALTIVPGDVISGGTIAGGCGVEFDRWIPEGAVVELEAQGIGVLRNRVGTKGIDVPLPASQRPHALLAPRAQLQVWCPEVLMGPNSTSPNIGWGGMVYSFKSFWGL